VWEYTPVIPATPDVEVGRLYSEATPDKVSMIFCLDKQKLKAKGLAAWCKF
jgi:hypothetical protein